MIGIIEYGISCLSDSNILFTTKNNKIKAGPANIARMLSSNLDFLPRILVL